MSENQSEAVKFLNYLSNPEALGSDDLLEIKDWVSKYPYSQSLKFIAAKAAQKSNSYQDLLAQAATIAPSRKTLHQLIHQPENFRYTILPFSVDDDQTIEERQIAVSSEENLVGAEDNDSLIFVSSENEFQASEFQTEKIEEEIQTEEVLVIADEEEVNEVEQESEVENLDEEVQAVADEEQVKEVKETEQESVEESIEEEVQVVANEEQTEEVQESEVENTEEETQNEKVLSIADEEQIVEPQESEVENIEEETQNEEVSVTTNEEQTEEVNQVEQESELENIEEEIVEEEIPIQKEEPAFQYAPQTDFFALNRKDKVEEKQAEEESEENVVNSEESVSAYNDERMPYTFLWWLNKTRKEHANTQPYSSFKLDTSRQIKKQSADGLNHQIAENIFHLRGAEELSASATNYTVPFDFRKKEFQIIEKFIKEEPQIRPPAANKIDSENKAKKSSEDNNQVVSETLAKIYVEQMLYHKALDVYKKLSLKYPEKSTYFASQIKYLELKVN